MTHTSPSPAVLECTQLERVLGRPEHQIPIERALVELANEQILVTGAAGSIGQALIPVLDDAGLNPHTTDLETLDVRHRLGRHLNGWRPTVIFHLAGAKHAPEGENDPWAVCETNTIGTRNVLELADRVVLASTCKAADPETAYGASKLLAERMVLNADGAVARFYNIVESAANVFETWAELPADAPVPVTSGHRYFISMREAIALLVWAAVLPSGRYTIAEVVSRWMPHVAADLYPARDRASISSRRGDRWTEPLLASCERPVRLTEPEGLLRLVNRHDTVGFGT